MDAIQPFLDYFSHNPGWALVVVFLIAFGEALLIIGLFVPSTAILLGAGALVGLGKLGFAEMLAATAIGAILGDQVSYWAGRFYGERLKTLWPLRNYPTLVERGETFVRDHGGKSIAIGRFVPGVKAVVPGIVGMLGMSQIYFAIVNFSSGIVWALAHIVPGILIGQGLQLANELSGRLALALVLFIALIAVAGWLIRLSVGWLSPVIARAQARVYRWSLTRPEKRWRRLGRILAPHNPRAATIIVFFLLAVVALATGTRIVRLVSVPGAMENVDLSVFRLLQSLRNAPFDELMVKATMLGDTAVIVALVAAMALWLIWRRAFRAGLALAATAAAAQIFVHLVKDWTERPRPLGFDGALEAFSFPSGHATNAMAAFGLFAVVAAAGLGRWSRALVYAGAAALALAIGFSRIYLGAHWLSDVAAGLIFGALFAAAFGIFHESFPPRRPQPIGFAAAALAAWLAAGAVHMSWSYESSAALYAPRSAVVLFDRAQWTGGQWAAVPARRIDMAGIEDEAFIAQWAGPPEAIAAAFEAKGWTRSPPWRWRDSIAYLNPAAGLGDLAPRPALHEGLTAGITLVKPNDGGRLVLRVWRLDFQIMSPERADDLHAVSLTRDTLRPRFSLYALPSPGPAAAEETAAAQDLLKAAGLVLPSASPVPLIAAR